MKKSVKLISSILGIIATVALITSFLAKVCEDEERNNYSSPIEVRYVAEKIIQNSEGHIYEYEYEFETENGTIYNHSDTKKSYQKNEKVRKNKNLEEGKCVLLTEEEFLQELKLEINLKKFSFIIAIISVILMIIVTIFSLIMNLNQVKKEKSEEEKMKLWEEDIPFLYNYIGRNYRKEKNVDQLLKLLDKLKRLIRDLDLFYQNREGEKEYRKGFRCEVENIINLYKENIEIDQKFDKKILKSSSLEELYQNLERFISYIDNEIESLTAPNDGLIQKEFDKINSKAELDGMAIEHLAKKYKE